MTPGNPEALRADLKELLIRKLRLRGVTAASITDTEPLVRGPLGLDSIDILEMALAVEERFGVKISDEDLGRQAFTSIAALADFIVAAHAAAAAPAVPDPPA